MLSCPNQTKASCLPFPIWHAEGKRDSPFLNMCLLMFKGWALLSTDQFTEHFSRDLSFSVSRQQINNVTSPQSKDIFKDRGEQEYTEGQARYPIPTTQFGNKGCLERVELGVRLSSRMSQVSFESSLDSIHP